MMSIGQLRSRFDPLTGAIAGAPVTRRRLSDLRGCFADSAAYEATLAAGDPLLYSVASVEPAKGEGDLHYGVGLLMPGRVGAEYFMTKGHLHSWRQAAEIYTHTGRAELWIVLDDGARVQVGDLVRDCRAGDEIWIPANERHRLTCASGQPVRVLEVAFGNWQQADITRYEDDFQRPPEGE